MFLPGKVLVHWTWNYNVFNKYWVSKQGSVPSVIGVGILSQKYTRRHFKSIVGPESSPPSRVCWTTSMMMFSVSLSDSSRKMKPLRVVTNMVRAESKRMINMVRSVVEMNFCGGSWWLVLACLGKLISYSFD